MPAGDALGGHLLQHLGDQRCAAPRAAAASWSSGIIRPWTTSATSGTDGICSAWASCGDGVDVDLAEQEPALELVGEHLEVVGQLGALGDLRRRVDHQQHRRVHRRLEVRLDVLLVEVDGVGAGAPPRGRPAGAEPARRTARGA